MRVFDHGKEDQVGLHAQSESRNNLSNTFSLNYLGRFGQWNLDLSANYVFNGWRSYYDLDRRDDYHLLYDRKDKTGWGNEQFRKNNMLEFTAIFRFSMGKQVRKVTLQTEDANVGSQF